MRTEWRLFAAVAVGGAVGSVARFALTSFIQTRSTGGFPMGTFVINVAGSLLLGFLVELGLGTTVLSPAMRVLLTTGFCGGFTTFSAFSYETVRLLEERAYATMSAYVTASVLFSVLFAVAGMRVARALLLMLRPGPL